MNSPGNEPYFTSAMPALRSLWSDQNLPDNIFDKIQLTGNHPALASSFAVSTAAQASVGAAAGMACLIAQHRGNSDLKVTVNSIDTALECTGYFKLNGTNAPKFAPLSGLYKTQNGYLRLHANFDHHRDIATRVAGLGTGSGITRSQMQETVSAWTTQALDDAITNAGGVCSSLRSFEQWDQHPQAFALANLPLIEITKIGEAQPRALSKVKHNELPLASIRILDLTRILAGPVCGRTLAAYGGDVMLVNSPLLPNIESIAETSQGKLSTHVDLQTPSGRNTLHHLVSSSRVFIQGYRPGALDNLGFGAEELSEQYPGIVCTSLSAYGRTGPWSARRGYDSLVQTACGFNVAEAEAFNSSAAKALPVQLLDYATGFLMSFATQVAIHRQATEGGSYHVQLSLARTAQWLRSMGQSTRHLTCAPLQPENQLITYKSGFGDLEALPHAAQFNLPQSQWKLPSVPPGTHVPKWP